MLQTPMTIEYVEADPTTLNDSTKLYGYEINQVNRLTYEEVTCFAEQIIRVRKTPECKGKRLEAMNKETWEVKEAKRQLIEANLRLVLKVARRYRRVGVDLMDLVQEGNIGLMHAVEKFDYRKGYRFSTYATWWIRLYIRRALAEQALISLPPYKLAEIKRAQKQREKLEQQLSAEPSPDELAAQMEVHVSHVVELLSQPEIYSLDVSHAPDESTLSESIEDESGDVPEQVALAAALREHVQEMLDTLSHLEQRVLQLRYGLDAGSNSREIPSLLAHSNVESYHKNATYSLAETGKIIGLSHEAVRQMELRALQKLYPLCRSRELQDFLR